jgi:signal transduction histidine kinase/CheY-like chemotaxis protein
MVTEDVLCQDSEAELYEQAPCGYLSTRPNGLIIKVNQTFLAWLGLEREQLIGKRRFQELLTIPGQIFFENHFHPILLIESRVNGVALDLKIPGRQPLPTLMTGVLKRDPSGAPVVMHLTVFNATERRAYEQALLKKTKELDLLNTRKNELLGMAAHDLRTPLGAISTYSNLLASDLGGSLSPIHREFLDTIIDMSAFMSDLITDILDVASIESGSLRLDRKSQVIEPVLRRAVSINAVLARKKGISIESDLQESETFCSVDIRKIDQVLNNLLGNAIKFSHAGTTIKLSMVADPDRVTIAIRDQGQGIPAEELGKIFTPFKTGSVRGTAGEPSTGLGLAIVNSIVTGHEGKIWVTSSVGMGSTFSFTLPRSTPPPRPVEKQPVASPVVSTRSSVARVLLAEDNIVNQKIVTMMLTRLGAEVLVANNGREALALLEHEQPDLVLMDCQMPEMDGYEATAAIRAVERRAGNSKHLPIIALTASVTEDDRRQCLAAGMDDFLQKPTGQPQLVEVLQRWVRDA